MLLKRVVETKNVRVLQFLIIQKTTFRANQIFLSNEKNNLMQKFELIFFQPAKAKILDREMSFVFQQNDQI